MTETNVMHSAQVARLFAFAPDIGTQVEYDGEQWEVSGWLRAAPEASGERAEEEGGFGILMHIEHDEGTLGEEERLRFCTRSKATHVSLKGIGGVVARIEDCKVLRAAEPSDKVKELKRIANGLVGVELF